jgi:hypothetical protein
MGWKARLTAHAATLSRSACGVRNYNPGNANSGIVAWSGFGTGGHAIRRSGVAHRRLRFAR